MTIIILVELWGDFSCYFILLYVTSSFFLVFLCGPTYVGLYTPCPSVRLSVCPWECPSLTRKR